MAWIASRRRAKAKRALLVLAFLVGPVAALVSWQLSERSSSPGTSAAHPARMFHAVDLHRRTIYRSPQRPGYTAWLGAWVMPDDSLMTAFVQATGTNGGRADFWGLHLAVKYLRSTDGGRTWRGFRTDPFSAAGPYGYTPQATIALRDGTLVRRVNGDDLRHDPSIPHTAYLQRLPPGAKRWGRPQVLMDPERFTYQISRLRYLRDGRLIATGNYWKVRAETSPQERGGAPSTFLLMVSPDDGRTWRSAMTIPGDVGYLPGDEWDTAELPNGDLVAVVRTLDSPSTQTPVRKQALLVKHGAGWVVTNVRKAPFPHSGHPELLATSEGPILHIATTGIHYTNDGISWRRLRFVPQFAYTSNYYPRSVQTSDGVIHVFSHVGGDDPYGQVDQSITMDTFRLVTDPES
jgi:hypothetical protein